MMKNIFWNLVLVLLYTIPSSAQYNYLNTVFKLKSDRDNPFVSYEDNYLDKQAEVILELVEEVLSKHTPQWPETMEHRSALYMLDAVLHDEKAPERLPVQEYLQKRIEKVAYDIENTTVEDGAIIWKLYSHSFIVRTKTVTMAFDLIRPSIRFKNFITDTRAELDRIVSQCDVLFISHAHGDHADPWVAQRFVDQGKPVVSPPDIWRERPLHKKITHLERNVDILHTLPVQNGNQELKLVVHPGHQYVGFDILNNIPVVYTPEGLSFSHTGDQDSWNDSLMISEIKDSHEIDILMCHSLMDVEWLRGFDPHMILPGHENEMSHPIHRRWSYWDKYARLDLLPYPYVVISWGEKYHYKRKK